MTNLQKKITSREFSKEWKDTGSEKRDTQTFWNELLQKVFGVKNTKCCIEYERPVRVNRKKKSIDCYIASTKVLIEQKSCGIDLSKKETQSDDVDLTPYEQAFRYASNIGHDNYPRWIVTCNFQEFWIYDMNKLGEQPAIVLLKNLEKDYPRLEFLVNTTTDINIKEEERVSKDAGTLVNELYDALLEQYDKKKDSNYLKSLNTLCVRLVFCFYAEDSGIFGKKDQFYHYLNKYKNEPSDVSDHLIKLFEILDTGVDKRGKYIDPDLAAFPYVNGGLFSDSHIEIPIFTPRIVELILEKCCKQDWSVISPTIFGALFESTLNPETRKNGGMHYTSIENIHKVIDPLFLNDLKEELMGIKKMQQIKKKRAALMAYQDKLASMTFLDPACGSGNFLTETYLSLRKLENIVLADLYGPDSNNPLGSAMCIEVSINQFYGIEINDFAVSVSRTALWISENQMLQATENIVQKEIDFLPLKSYPNIHEGNALTMDWESVISRKKLSYIIGNPPFSGARLMSEEQKIDLINVLGSCWKGAGNMDYVCAWYKKSVDMMKGTEIRAALVSTNSITQGEQVATLWKPLIADGLHIDFAHRTFRWDSEAKIKAHVHCVIIGYSLSKTKVKNIIYLSNGSFFTANHINGYLIDYEDVYIGSRQQPLCDVPTINIGNKPIDNSNYLFSEKEMKDFIKTEPASAKYFKKFYGSDEFINQRPRYCLWVGECTPNELRSMPHVLDRVRKVREFRLASKSAGTRNLADKPTRFHVENMPKVKYLVIPETSSERRKYIPIGFLTPHELCSNALKLMPNATMYHFGVLTSCVHNAWMRAVCGRLKSDYRYSKDIVYNNFPWPQPTPKQKSRIEKTAQGILDARAKYPDSSLADLYDIGAIPSELKTAHDENDIAVMAAYGISQPFVEERCVAELFKRYQKLISSIKD